MRQVGGELRQAREGILQPIQHGVKGRRQLSQFRRPARSRDPFVQLAGGDVLRGLRDLHQRPHALAGHPYARHRGKDHSQDQHGQEFAAIVGQQNGAGGGIERDLQCPLLLAGDPGRGPDRHQQKRPACQRHFFDAVERLVRDFHRGREQSGSHEAFHAGGFQQHLALLVQNAEVIPERMVFRGFVLHFAGEHRRLVRLAQQEPQHLDFAAQQREPGVIQVPLQGPVEKPGCQQQ